MGVATSTMPTSDQSRSFSATKLIKWAVLAAVVALNGYAVVMMYATGEYALALLTLVLVASGVYVYTNAKTYSHRYVYPGIAAMITFIIFPLCYTVWMAFTNYSGTNLLTLERAQAYHLQKTYAAEGGSFKFTLFDTGEGTYQFFLDANESDQKLISEPLTLMPEADYKKATAGGKELDPSQVRFDMQPTDAAPALKKGSIRLLTKDFRSYVNALVLVTPEGNELVKDGLRKFSSMKPLFELTDDDILVNQQDGTRYKPNFEAGDVNKDYGFYFPIDDNGEFILDANGKLTGKMAPGFIADVGWNNFTKVVTDKGVQGPFIQIFIWTVVFATLTVAITLAIGMILASLVQWEELKGRAIYRLLLILPYAVPAFISILVFKGLFNQNFGEINALLSYIGLSPKWMTDPFMAKTMIIIVNAWLGYPYMMILCMGMLKAIPEDLYEASAMDGAGPIDNFFKITLPLIFKPMIPLLIASFAFNFNNFVLIQLLTDGRPDILGSNPSAGTTDILVSYTFRIAFEAGGATDYGLAGAIATLIFLVVGALAVLNLKLTKTKI